MSKIGFAVSINTEEIIEESIKELPFLNVIIFQKNEKTVFIIIEIIFFKSNQKTALIKSGFLNFKIKWYIYFLFFNLKKISAKIENRPIELPIK